MLFTLYLSLGLKLVKVHKVLTFRHSPWLKSFITYNINKRKLSKNEFEKNFYKMINNAVYGKTFENVRKRIKFDLVHNKKKFLKLVNDPSFERYNVISDTMVGVHRKKTNVRFDKPIYVGIAILDLNKHIMYDFYYNVMKKKYGNRLHLLGTDTDSLKYLIEAKDINDKDFDFYNDMYEMKQYYDLSDYPKKPTEGYNPLYDPIYKLYDDTNKKVLGKFKDESEGKLILEFVGLKSKMYSQLTLNYNNNKIAPKK
jgi:hypothetical protein